MIEDIVTFFGEQGHRKAEVGFFASGIVPPFYIVDFYYDETDSQLTRYFDTKEEAEEAAKKYAFDGILEDIK